MLNDGTLKGVISMEDSSWNKGELYSAPRGWLMILFCRMRALVTVYIFISISRKKR